MRCFGRVTGVVLKIMFLGKAEQVTWRILHVGVGKVGG